MMNRRHPALVSLWIKPEPFSFGILPVNPAPKLALKFLKKIIPYTLKKKEIGFPKLKYSVWRHIACTKLQLQEDLAWLYFTTYHSLTKIRTEERIAWENEFFKYDYREKDNVKSSCQVDTLKFAILLMIQMVNKTNVRSASVSSLSIEEWPSHSHSFNESRRDKKPVDEECYLEFILSRMEDLLELISLTNDATYKDDRLISIDSLVALDFIIEGSYSSQITICPVSELITKHRSICGYCPPERAFQLRPLAAWLRSKFVNNPFGVSTCLTSGHRLSWPSLSKYDDDKINSPKGRTASNVLFAPKGKTVIVLSQLRSQTIFKSPHVLRGAHIHIHRCQQSYIYLLSALKCVSIYKCRDCTIVLGPTSSCVRVSMCKNITLISVTRQLWISETAHSCFYLLIPTRPLLAGNRNDSLLLAPYHTFYPTLEEHMLEAGIGSLLNNWDNPLCLASDSRVEMSKSWTTLKPAEFFNFSIPFEMSGSTKKIPNHIPDVYQQALRQREQVLQKWSHTVDKANLTNEQHRQLNSLLEMRFQSWLITTGHQTELDSLSNMQKYSAR